MPPSTATGPPCSLPRSHWPCSWASTSSRPPKWSSRTASPTRSAIASFQNDTLTVENGTKLIINSGAVFGGTGERAGEIVARPGSQWIIRAESFDTTSYNPTSGGILGVTFPGKSALFISWNIAGGKVKLEVVVSAPVLRMGRTAASLKLSWSQSAVGYRLQSTGGFSNASEWTVWPEAPVSDGDLWVVQLPPATTAFGHQFFQLPRD